MGVQIQGDTGNVIATKGTYSGNVTIGGTLTYEDVTNVDSIGLVTARNGIEVGARPGVAASISVDGNAIFSGIVTATTIKGAGALTSLDVSGGLGIAESLFHLDDTNTRVAFPANDTISADTSGTERARIESAGNVKIEKNLNVVGVVTATSFSGSGANLTGISAGITMSDQWRITSDNNKTNNEIIDSNWERNDVYFAQLGSGMTQSSGVFTFPSTGIYFILAQIQMNGSASYAGAKLEASADGGSSFDTISYALQNPDGYSHLTMHVILDVTNTSNFKVHLKAINASSTQYSGSTDYHRTGLTFIRLGDT